LQTSKYHSESRESEGGKDVLSIWLDRPLSAGPGVGSNPIASDIPMLYVGFDSLRPRLLATTENRRGNNKLAIWDSGLLSSSPLETYCTDDQFRLIRLNPTIGLVKECHSVDIPQKYSPLKLTLPGFGERQGERKFCKNPPNIVGLRSPSEKSGGFFVC
jgi:hypothetical protein